MPSPANPFRVGGPVAGPYFTNRSAELTRVAQTLIEPQAKLLVYGPRRMGKTSLLHVAVDRVRRKGGHALYADLSTASTLGEVTNRILQAAVRALGRQWGDVAATIVKRLQVKLTMEPDAVTGLALPSLDVGLRSAPEDEQRTTLERTLDAIEDLARAKETTIGIVLDEFQEIHKFGGDVAEWHLRGTIQHHAHVSYVLAGSDERLIRAMLGKSRAFYQMLELLHVGPIDAAHLARWIESRFDTVGGCEPGVGARIVEVAGPRTRDVVQLARATADLVGPDRAAQAADIEQAFAQILTDGDDAWRSLWDTCALQQQQVLRAVAVRGRGLTTTAVRTRFALGDTGTATHAATTLVGHGILVKQGARQQTEYVFDNPFQRGWVITRTLPDIGILLPATHLGRS